METAEQVASMATCARGRHMEAGSMALHPNITRDLASNGGQTCIDCGFGGEHDATVPQLLAHLAASVTAGHPCGNTAVDIARDYGYRIDPRGYVYTDANVYGASAYLLGVMHAIARTAPWNDASGDGDSAKLMDALGRTGWVMTSAEDVYREQLLAAYECGYYGMAADGRPAYPA
jgi:hypothetical protein